ncbi:uncharacterized protein Dyak_GE29074 [Drosophila yakuba]|uniref:Uncharacterized protein n=1 Tax=Drosophila yakuba TaxID=7245 RepID=A0A0R1EE73_DROYA|nr:uncharacterized protein Dyak_GE28220 [Drosophila yakuba]KRK05492.1 uncharacterized protein Dyak_GE29074 [Drosophila yakuba]
MPSTPLLERSWDLGRGLKNAVRELPDHVSHLPTRFWVRLVVLTGLDYVGLKKTYSFMMMIY